MTKDMFIEKLEEMTVEGFTVELESKVDQPSVLGCYHTDGIWKIYKNTSSGDFHLIKAYVSEETAFNYFYQLVQMYIGRGGV